MLSNAAHPEDKRGESNLKSAIIRRRWSNELTSSNLNKTKYHQHQSYTVKSECWSGSLYLEVVFRWQPLHCTTSSQQSVHVFRSDQPGQEIKENTTFTFDIQHCLTCAHDCATLSSNIFKQLKHFNFETKTNELTECWWSICHVMTKYLSVRHTIFLPLQTSSHGTNYDQLSFDLYLLQ